MYIRVYIWPHNVYAKNFLQFYTRHCNLLSHSRGHNFNVDNATAIPPNCPRTRYRPLVRCTCSEKLQNNIQVRHMHAYLYMYIDILAYYSSIVQNFNLSFSMQTSMVHSCTCIYKPVILVYNFINKTLFVITDIHNVSSCNIFNNGHHYICAHSQRTKMRHLMLLFMFIN